MAKQTTDAAEYAFEKGSSGHRSRDAVTGDVHVLLTRLGIDLRGEVGQFIKVELLQDFAVHCHLSIQWYQENLARLVRWRRFYFLVTMILVATIPIAVFAISAKAAGQSTGTEITTQLSAIVAGIIGFQRALTAWLDKRGSIGSYAKARAELKQQLYALEQKWEVRAVKVTDCAEFVADVRAGTARCREIVEAEQLRYFENLSSATIDLGSTLRSAATDALGVTTDFTSDRAKKAKERADTVQKSVRADAFVVQCRRLLAQRQLEFDEKKKAGAAAAELQKIGLELTNLEQKLRAAELDAASSLADLQSVT